MLRSEISSDFARAARERLADDVIEAYVCWREACEAVARSYADWCHAARGERRLGHAVHLAAVDREECAAQAYRDAVERAGRELAGHGR
jgi:hypothetical protein